MRRPDRRWWRVGGYPGTPTNLVGPSAGAGGQGKGKEREGDSEAEGKAMKMGIRIFRDSKERMKGSAKARKESWKK
jgi:hypothetical protein